MALVAVLTFSTGHSLFAKPLSCEAVFKSEAIFKSEAQAPNFVPDAALEHLKTDALNGRMISTHTLIKEQVAFLKPRIAELRKLAPQLGGRYARDLITRLDSVEKDLAQPFDYRTYVLRMIKFTEVSDEIEYSLNPPARDRGQAYRGKPHEPYSSVDYASFIRDDSMRALAGRLRELGLNNDILPLPMSETLSEERLVELWSQGLMPLGVLLKAELEFDGGTGRALRYLEHDIAHTLALLLDKGAGVLGPQAHGLLSTSRKFGLTPLEVFKKVTATSQAFQTRFKEEPNPVVRYQLNWVLFRLLHEEINLAYLMGHEAPARTNSEAWSTLFAQTASRDTQNTVEAHGQSWSIVFARFRETGRALGLEQP